MSPFRRLHWGWWLLLLPPGIFFLLFFIYPLASIFDISLRPGGQLDLDGFARIITRPYYRDTIVFTAYQATLSTLLTLALALPSAYIFARYRFWGKDLWLSLATIPFVLPTVVVAMALTTLLGQRGWLNQTFIQIFQLDTAPIQIQNSLTMILIAHVFYNYAIALRIIASYWLNQSPHHEETARMLGARGWRLWWYVYLPMLRPAITASSLLVFIFTFTSFGVVLILGGIRFATLEVQIYYQALNIFDLPMAASLSLVQIVFMFVMMLVYTRLQKHMTTDLQSSHLLRPLRTIRERAIVGAWLILMSLFLMTPLLSLAIRAFHDGQTWSLRYFYALFDTPSRGILFVPPHHAITNSLIFAIITTFIAVFLGVMIATLIANRDKVWMRWLDPFFMLPLATSAVTLGFGYIIALDKPPLNLRSSWLLIPIAHSLVAIPFVVRSVLPALRAIPPHTLQAARVLGAHGRRLWWHIERPLIARAVGVGATFAFTVSMGEFGASLFVARPDTPTLPIVIYRLLGQPGMTNFGQATALSVLLMLVCLISFVAIERIRVKGIGEF